MARLRRSDPSGPGFTRHPSGRGFTYRDPSDATVTNPALRARFDRLVIPPAWRDVWIAPHENGHIQAVGIDDAGRRQYIYHPEWRARKDRDKFDRALALAAVLPAARRRVTRMLRQEGMTRSRVLAASFRMLDSASLRVGGEEYVHTNGSHGLSTLLCEHVGLDGETVTLSFPAKSGQPWVSEITDTDLVSFLRSRLSETSEPRLLAWDEDGVWHALSSGEVNDYVREVTGDEFTAKDFRTLRGTVVAARSLAAQATLTTKRARTKAVSQAMSDAAAVLGNTAAIARKSYVDPRLVDHYFVGETIRPRGRTAAEGEVRALLSR